MTGSTWKMRRVTPEQRACFKYRISQKTVDDKSTLIRVSLFLSSKMTIGGCFRC